MNHTRFKEQLVRDKAWLKQLYENQSITNLKQLIRSASDKQLDTLIRFFHYLSNGVIKMHKKNFDALEKRHILYLRKSFESKVALKKLISGERSEKLKKILKIANILSLLLYTLFNDSEN